MELINWIIQTTSFASDAHFSNLFEKSVLLLLFI